MNIEVLVAAFGGGVFGALISGTASFVFTGILALIGIAISLSGGGDLMLTQVAFGPFFGPQVAFVGGVAAAAYLGKKRCGALETAGLSIDAQVVYAGDYKELDVDQDYLGKLVDGTDTMTPLFKCKDSMVLIVGGLFGVLGYMVNYAFSEILALRMDTIALTVVVMAIVARLIFGKSGLTGLYPKDESRFGPIKETLGFNSIWAFFLSIVTAYAVIELQVNNLGWAISAVTLMFLWTGLPFPVSHHITMVTGYAALQFNNIWIAAVFGLLAMISGEYVQRMFNNHVDSHIDMPAVVIAFLSVIILGVLG